MSIYSKIKNGRSARAITRLCFYSETTANSATYTILSVKGFKVRNNVRHFPVKLSAIIFEKSFPRPLPRG